MGTTKQWRPCPALPHHATSLRVIHGGHPWPCYAIIPCFVSCYVIHLYMSHHCFVSHGSPPWPCYAAPRFVLCYAMHLHASLHRVTMYHHVVRLWVTLHHCVVSCHTMHHFLLGVVCCHVQPRSASSLHAMHHFVSHHAPLCHCFVPC